MSRENSYHHGDLRRALLDAAAQLIQEKGSAGASLREVARRAGVSHAAPYRHFASKEALLASIAEEGFEQLRIVLEEAAAEKAPLDALRDTGCAYIEFAIAHPGYFRVMFSPEAGAPCDYPSLVAASRGAFGVLVRTIQSCIEAGEVRDEPAGELALVAWSCVHGLSTLILDGMLEEAGTPDRLAQLVTSHLANGLRTP